MVERSFHYRKPLIRCCELQEVMIPATDILLGDVTMLFMFIQYQGKNRWGGTMKGIKMLQLFLRERFPSPEWHVHTQ